MSVPPRSSVMPRAATRYLQVAALLAWLAGCGLANGQEPRPTFKAKPKAPSQEPSPELPPSSPARAIPSGSLPRMAAPGARAAAPSRIAPSKEQIAAWIRELDADEFFTRETATLQLLEAGPAVLGALKPVLTGGTPEATSRALFIVRQLG